MRVNKVERIALMGGLIGALLTNPRGALDKALSRANVDGWYCRQILPHSTSNLFMLILSVSACASPLACGPLAPATCCFLKRIANNLFRL